MQSQGLGEIPDDLARVRFSSEGKSLMLYSKGDLEGLFTP